MAEALDDFFSDIAGDEISSGSITTAPVVDIEVAASAPPAKRAKMAEPQVVISAKPQPQSSTISAAPVSSSPYAHTSATVAAMSTAASTLPYSTELSSGYYGDSSSSSSTLGAPASRENYKAAHMGMTDHEARLVESQQKGYDYQKQQELAKMGVKPAASRKKFLRTDGDSTWEDKTLGEWPDGDTRLFCGDLGNEVTDDLLSRAFAKYPSFVKAKIVRDKFTTKSKGFGFASFMDPFDAVKALREMNGKYVGNRPIRLSKSDWNQRELGEVRKKEKQEKKKKATLGLA